MIQCTNASTIQVRLKTFSDYKGREKLYDYEQVFNQATGKIYKIKIPTSLPVYVLQLHVINVERTYDRFSDLIPINRLQENQQSIYLVDPTTNSPILKNYLNLSQEFSIEHRLSSVDKFFIKFFNPSFIAATPPHGSLSRIFNPLNNYDQLYEVQRGKGLKLTEAGLYFIQTDSNSNKGVFLNCYTNDFPKTTQVSDLIESLRYITKQEEYEQLLSSKKPKLALDNYWLSRRQYGQRNTQKTKSLISIYYNRIQNANLQFTSFKEGWKTDRGMIYVVFGKPDVVRKYAAQEIWSYRSNNGRYTSEFIFDRIGEQYLLKRNQYLRPVWQAKIKQWRNGTINF